MSQAEREYIETSLQRENAEASPFAGYRSVFRSSVVWRLVVVYFLIQVGFYGLNLWLPHLVTVTIGASILTVGVVTVIPYMVAIVGLWLNACYADRNGRYCRHVMISLAFGAVALVLSVGSCSRSRCWRADWSCSPCAGKPTSRSARSRSLLCGPPQHVNGPSASPGPARDQGACRGLPRTDGTSQPGEPPASIPGTVWGQ